MPLYAIGNQRRSPDQILRDLSASQIDPASIQGSECKLLMKHCEKRVKRLQVKAAIEKRRGRDKIARRYQTELFEGLSARLSAGFKACKTHNARRRKRSRGLLQPRGFSHVWSVANRLKDPHAPARATYRTKRKARGGDRRYFEFDEFGTAKHVLFVNAVLPFASFHPSQFARRGRSAACESLHGVMNRLLFTTTRFIQSDVTDFYESISPTYVEEMLPVPKAITRSTIFMDGWHIGGMGHTMGRRGLPSGSAGSSLVAEMVMANVLRDLADQIADMHSLHSYSDDVGGLLPPNRDEVALMERLRIAFFSHPAGPFRIRIEQSLVSQPFRFLGYSWVLPRRNQARAFVPTETWQLKAMELTTAFADAETLQERLDVCVRLRSYCEAFKLAPQTRELLKEVVQFIREDLAFRMGSPPRNAN